MLCSKAAVQLMLLADSRNTRESQKKKQLLTVPFSQNLILSCSVAFQFFQVNKKNSKNSKTSP